jgi:uncharacterized membrane protein
MNIYNILLIAHLSGALVMGALIIQTIFVLAKNKSRYYKQTAKNIALNTGFQLVSGATLALTHAGTDPLAQYCSKIGIYLALVTFAEFFLYKQLKNEKEAEFPVRTVVSSVSTGILFAVFTGITLYT